MTNHVARLYAIVVGVVVFFVAWAAVAAHPWQATAASAADPRIAALAARQALLQRESVQVKRVLDRRWAAYRIALHNRKAAIVRVNAAAAQARAQAAQIQTQVVSATVAAAPSAPAAAAAPAVRVVTLPPLVITKTS